MTTRLDKDGIRYNADGKCERCGSECQKPTMTHCFSCHELATYRMMNENSGDPYR